MSRILVEISGFSMAVYLTKDYLAGVADVGFYSKVFATSFIVLAVLLSLSTFLSDRAITLIPYSIIGGTILLLCVRGFGLLTEEDKPYLEYFIPSRMARLMRFLL